MTANGIQYAMIYDAWFPSIPAPWVKVGELKLDEQKISPAYDAVSLYAIAPSSQKRLRQVLEELSSQGSSRRDSLNIYQPRGGVED